MTKIYHILGANIPHHNRTILQFFSERLQPLLPDVAMVKFLLVGESLEAEYPSLQIEEYASKSQIAKAVVAIAQQQTDVHFYFHGQYNFPIWLAILMGKLPVERLTWHIWGADLHQDSTQWKFKLAYPLRRFIQKKLKFIVGYQGDLHYFRQYINPNVNAERVYFPSKMDRHFQPVSKNTAQPLTVLVGNSGDLSNRHQDALHYIRQQLGENVRIIIPMGYPENNAHYIAQVKAAAKALFAESAVQILTEKMPFNDYLALLNQCDVAYFIFHRQQGVGSLCILTQLNIPVVLHPKNTFIDDMNLYQVPFLCLDNVNAQEIEKTQQKLTALDKESIEFFDPYFIQGWQKVLQQILVR
ncbi:hypothetical protein A4G18_09055 [Pasteurellaceae bacterium Pebbles2]|nr:hypothetical protein [Pasteurellaceae bacterium Pebbles2]